MEEGATSPRIFLSLGQSEYRPEDLGFRSILRGTAILLCGILTCRQHFTHPEIHELASEIYNRVDWNWLSEDTPVLPHGWTPESGFLQYRWNDYSEMMMMHLLGLGSDVHPLPSKAWDSWKRPAFEYNGIRYIGSFAPLFIHQYSQAWFDFRGKRDR
jgi:hypothetical protein